MGWYTGQNLRQTHGSCWTFALVGWIGWVLRLGGIISLLLYAGFSNRSLVDLLELNFPLVSIDYDRHLVGSTDRRFGIWPNTLPGVVGTPGH